MAEIKNIYEKLGEIQLQLKAPKSQYNKFSKFNYRSTEDILEALKPLLRDTKTVIVFSDKPLSVGEKYYIEVTLKLINIEKPEETIEVTACARELDNPGKNKMDDTQATGSASSYARKYALNGLFAIDDTKDSDFTNKGENQSAEPVKGKRLDQTGNPELITEKQRKLLFARSKEKQLSEEAVKLLLGNYGYESSKNIKRTDFNKILEDLDKAK